MSEVPHDRAYIAKLWDYPKLCVALFGVQFHTPAGQRRYEEAGIQEELEVALAEAVQEGILLLNRPVMTPEGPVLMQYWRSYDELDDWARALPHMRWWKWLLDNAGPDLSFYHEIYQAKTAEAIFERGCTPVGPALFCEVMPVHAGEGRSKERQRRFAEAAALHSVPRD
jgi:hypothetical protein